MLLELRAVSVSYDTAEVLHCISLQVDTGETVTLIGANGAGKTSCLRAVSGLVPLSSGEVWFCGERIDTVTPRRRVEMGLVQVPEGKRLFPRMTVRENLEMGAFLRSDPVSVQSDLNMMF